MDANKLHRGILLALGGSFWAAAYLIPYKAAARETSADALTLAMLFSAAVFNSIPIWRKNRKNRQPHTPSRRMTLIAACVLGGLSIVGNYAMAEALVSLSPAIASVLLRSQVLFVGLVGWAWLGERLSFRFAIGMLFTLFGLVLIKIQPAEKIVFDTQGLFWIVAAAVSFALMQLVARRCIHHINPITVNALRLWIAVLILFIPSLCFGRLPKLSLQTWFFAGLAALFGPFLSRIYYMMSLQHIPTALSTLVGMTSPLFAFFLGMIFFQTWPDAIEIIGGFVMLFGISLPIFETRKKSTGYDEI